MAERHATKPPSHEPRLSSQSIAFAVTVELGRERLLQVRHVYFPCLRAGLTKNAASALCFLLSAVLHELLVSVPFHMVRELRGR